MSDNDQPIRVAAIQAAPVFLDRDASVEKAVSLIREAAQNGAMLAAFGEAWLPGYPIHAAAATQDASWWELAAEYLNQAVDIPGSSTDALCQAALEADIDVVIGVAERDSITGGSVYSAQLLIGRDGRIVNRHRKLKPAFFERLVWADGDAVGMQVNERDYAIVSALTGTEHQMVLPTYALAEQGTQIHVASFPGSEPATAPASPVALWSRQLLLSRAFAAQAAAYVVCVGAVLAPDGLPERFRAKGFAGLDGHSAIIDPRGEIIAGPVTGETILYADCDMAVVRAAKVAFDCAGHSGRTDQLRFWNQAHGPAPDLGGEPTMDDDDGDENEPSSGSGGPRSAQGQGSF